jgi:CheY-like chemotaxis protein
MMPIVVKGSQYKSAKWILVADPSAITRRVVREILVGQGFRVLMAPTAADALRVISRLSSRLQAIVAEGVWTGFDVGREIARIAPKVPTLAMVNNASRALLPGPLLPATPSPGMEVRQPSPYDVINKPFTRALLVSKLLALIARADDPGDSTPSSLYKIASHGN